jgi:hypothetical protein
MGRIDGTFRALKRREDLPRKRRVGKQCSFRDDETIELSTVRPSSPIDEAC